jgi:hypothetical protein
MRRTTLTSLGALAALVLPAPADAGCGCSKPPPARAAVRPFAGYRDQKITLFNDTLAAGQKYDVYFEGHNGSADWSRGKAVTRRDLADGQLRTHLVVPVASVSLGPCRISVWQGGVKRYALSEGDFTVIAPPVTLHDFAEVLVRDNYRTGVGTDGTMYIAVDVEQVNEATTFAGEAVGLPIRFAPEDVAMFNEQGFLMQLLDPDVPGLFRLTRGGSTTSDLLEYWRHEFRTYKQEHRRVDARRANDEDPAWHADGSYHVDHDRIVVAIRGSRDGGGRLEPGATPAFRLVVSSSSEPLASTDPAGL